MPILHLVTGPASLGKQLYHAHLLRARHPRLPVLCRAHVADTLHAAPAALLREQRSFIFDAGTSRSALKSLLDGARAWGYEVVLHVLDETPGPSVRRAMAAADSAFVFDLRDAHRGGPRLLATAVRGVGGAARARTATVLSC